MIDQSILLPDKILVKAVCKRVHLHWTAGPAQSRADEAVHYHAILNRDLTINPGLYTIMDNYSIPPGKKDYAAHTKGANTQAFGYSLAGMRGAKESPFDPGPDPITEEQWSRAMIHIAQICKTYGITVGPKTVLTHAEVTKNLGIKQNGKWDITVLPWQTDKWNTAEKVGNLMRAEVLHILKKGELP